MEMTDVRETRLEWRRVGKHLRAPITIERACACGHRGDVAGGWARWVLARHTLAESDPRQVPIFGSGRDLRAWAVRGPMAETFRNTSRRI